MREVPPAATHAASLPDVPVAALPALRAMRQISLPLADGSALPVQLLAFDEARFSVEAFAAAGIACPDSVTRSVRKRQAEFFFGRLAARCALRALDPAGAAAEVAIGPRREPRWPEGVIGSISHSHGLAAASACARGRWQGVGIDLEQVVDATSRAALVATVVDEAELALLRTHGQGPPLDALLTVAFSAKESLFKGAYVSIGDFFDFSAARLTALDFVRGRLNLRLTRTLNPYFAEGRFFELGFQFLDSENVMTHFVW